MINVYFWKITGLILFVIIVLCLLFRPIAPFEIKNSQVHGVGVFATKDHDANEKLFLVINCDKTIEETLGSKVNHCPSSSKKMNTKLVKVGNEWYAYSSKKILKGEELTTDYVQTPYFIMKPDKNYVQC